MGSLAAKLSDIVGNAFEDQGLPKALGMVRVSDRPDLAQFQCNGAMGAAKLAKQAPRAVAEKIAESLKQHDIFTKIEIAGPGFINLDITDAAISEFIADYSADEKAGIKPAEQADTIVLDYGGPNIAKAMHVGHLRSSIIGDCLRRMYLFAGYKALGDVHMGDWGLPMGQVLSELQISHPDWPYFDENHQGDYPTQSPVTMEDLAEIYPQASGACKADESRLAFAREITAKLQDGHAGYRALWQHFIDVSIAGMKENFDALGVHFDLWLGEASAHDSIAPMVKRLEDQDLVKESDGALIVEVAQEDDKKEMPPLILYKRDGAVMYGTTDLATLVQRMEDHGPAKIVYIVDQRQALHFEQLFRAARLGNIVPEQVPLIHAGFGTMNGTDGKPFKTRAGGVMKLEDLIALGVEKANARLAEANLASDFSDEEKQDIATKVGIAAIKFADLQNNRISDYIFDMDRMTAFEGKTGPYLLYQIVRIRSLLNKAKAQGVDAADTVSVHPEDRELCLLMAEFSDHFALALDNHTPHVLCDYAYKLAQSFSSFYGSCHILSEADEAVRASRLKLCALVARQLDLIIALLGINAPERM